MSLGRQWSLLAGSAREEQYPHVECHVIRRDWQQQQLQLAAQRIHLPAMVRRALY